MINNETMVWEADFLIEVGETLLSVGWQVSAYSSEGALSRLHGQLDANYGIERWKAQSWDAPKPAQVVGASEHYSKLVINEVRSI